MCGTHGAEKAASAQQSNFTDQMMSQASQVFGADNAAFNAVTSSFNNIVAAGASQQGFSAAQQSSMNASAITNIANQTRFLAGQQAAAGAVTPGGVGRFGGGQSTGASGVPAASASIYQQGAAQEANALNQIQQQNWAQGNSNWRYATQGLESAPSMFNNMGSFDSAAQGGLDRNMANAQAADAASNWWVKPVAGLAGAGLGMVTGGLGSMAMGGTMMQGMGASLLGGGANLAGNLS